MIRHSSSLLLLLILISLSNTFCSSADLSPETSNSDSNIAETGHQFSVGVSVTPDSGSSKEDVFTYYQKLQSEYIPTYKIQQGKEGFYTKSQNGEKLKPVMDIANGYIEIMDDQLGEGHVKVQFVLFKKADASDVIAISIQRHDGFGLSQESIVLHIINGKPVDKTKEAFGNLSPWTFLPDDYAEEEHIVADALPVLIDLPRKGTTAKAVASTEKKFYYCSDKANTEQAIACGVYGRLLRTSIDLKWNKKEGVFEWD
jgi:hypothetical protein